jgi:hypothetical protein
MITLDKASDTTDHEWNLTAEDSRTNLDWAYSERALKGYAQSTIRANVGEMLRRNDPVALALLFRVGSNPVDVHLGLSGHHMAANLLRRNDPQGLADAFRILGGAR